VNNFRIHDGGPRVGGGQELVEHTLNAKVLVKVEGESYLALGE